jgi:hypothetical protein
MGMSPHTGAGISVAACPADFFINLPPGGRMQGDSVLLPGFDWCTGAEAAGCHSVLASGYICCCYCGGSQHHFGRRARRAHGAYLHDDGGRFGIEVLNLYLSTGEKPSVFGCERLCSNGRASEEGLKAQWATELTRSIGHFARGRLSQRYPAC